MHRTPHPYARFAALALGLSLVLAACSTGDESSSSTELLPFADVADSEFVFDSDPAAADGGIFRVTTTEPMICAIVWGETEDFGNFNNSLAMSGTGIVDHDVFLPGAVPGVTYTFRVQGSTADGRQYRSETGTFTIPGTAQEDEAVTRDPGNNLATGATVVGASSEFNDGFAAVNAIDDDGATEWSSDGDGDDTWITVDLGSEQEIAGVEYITRSMADGSAIAETFTVTIDGGDVLGPFPTGTPAEPAVAPIDITGREIRFDVDTSTGGNVGAIDIRILAPAP